MCVCLSIPLSLSLSFSLSLSISVSVSLYPSLCLLSLPPPSLYLSISLPPSVLDHRQPFMPTLTLLFCPRCVYWLCLPAVPQTVHQGCLSRQQQPKGACACTCTCKCTCALTYNRTLVLFKPHAFLLVMLPLVFEWQPLNNVLAFSCHPHSKAPNMIQNSLLSPTCGTLYAFNQVVFFEVFHVYVCV